MSNSIHAMLKKQVYIGLAAGLVVGIVESLIFSTVSGIGALFSDLTLGCLVLGAIVGWLASGTLSKKEYYLGAAGAGFLVFLFLAINSGMYLDDLVLGVISGLIIGAITMRASTILLGGKELLDDAEQSADMPEERKQQVNE